MNMSILQRSVVITAMSILYAQRLPAPIVEPADQPTPAPQTETPSAPERPAKSKHKTEPAAKAETKPAAKSQQGFGGTWTGKINQGLLGDIVLTLTVDASGSQVVEHTALGTFAHPATLNGRTLTWHGGLLNEITWTLTPNENGARITSLSPLGINSQATFTRGGKPAVAQVPQNKTPTAQRDPSRPGFVINPFNPNDSRRLDVRGKASGTKLKDPTSGREFIVP
ncbi:MAG: hypothetical protein QOG48_953 [Verrucomicrobiota bacterium]|jgi:hypothetical protein